MITPFFSVIIPAYNREKYAVDCLESVFAQSFKDYEIIVIDDGSTDNTLKILKDFKDRIQLISRENGGAGAARQAGCDLARGQYIAFLDSDDLWFPWTLAVYNEILVKEHMPSILWGAIHSFKGESVPKFPPKERISYIYAQNFYSLKHPCPMVATCNFVIRCDAFELTSGFFKHRHLCEDTSLFLEAGLSNGALYMNSPLVVAHRDTPGSFIKHSHYWYDGLLYLKKREESGSYPGGVEWQNARRNFIAMNFRSASVRLMRRKQYISAWKLYFISIKWQLQFLRIKFIFGLPLVFIVTLFSSAQD